MRPCGGWSSVSAAAAHRLIPVILLGPLTAGSAPAPQRVFERSKANAAGQSLLAFLQSISGEWTRNQNCFDICHRGKVLFPYLFCEIPSKTLKAMGWIFRSGSAERKDAQQRCVDRNDAAPGTEKTPIASIFWAGFRMIRFSRKGSGGTRSFRASCSTPALQSKRHGAKARARAAQAVRRIDKERFLSRIGFRKQSPWPWREYLFTVSHSCGIIIIQIIEGKGDVYE